MNFNDLTSFNKMITPTIIKFIFWVGVGFSIISGLIQIVAGISSPWGGGVQVILGLITLVVGPLLARVYCELMIVIFKMHETLRSIDGKIINKTED
ncbi:DUF4282 domain-containing protein [Aquibacillus rhizosphaerae]|uniref:DUF4282 domain-containing protein n=1 Tax=Aquibacillus rhizosphaerae TaxID=3051431 RepID=A0ABT7L887_9BACI|nr:DUF4282 domain-containing protein [Aquibacillus sp. LR5S19]MDL4842085.1 DUF4282 domain-containing protein [Aquibacillus sp. LR5S19]